MGSLNGFLRLLAAAASLCVSACLNSTEPETYFRLEAGPNLLDYSRIAINLDDTTGRRVATLYDDTLPDLKRLERLPARSYSGETARILIEGYHGSRLAYRETRLYEGSTQRLLDLRIERFDDSAKAVPDPGTAAGASHPPFLSSFPSDTAVSIRDSVPLTTEVYDADGDLASYAWQCGDGPKDSAVILGSQARIRFGVRYADSGQRVCTLRVWDLKKGLAEAKVKVNVELDPPWADAGKDTTVPVGGVILLHARGEDGFGPIVYRAWSFDGAPFANVPQTETTLPVPKSSGDLTCILRVIDSDNLMAYDTLVVHVTPAGNSGSGNLPDSSVTP
ncbi:MAG: hypothetical protein JF616_00875 [Fibrobacteres bacterium]|nr:hypothetical protein [Fibrobacterota bacterium]